MEFNSIKKNKSSRRLIRACQLGHADKVKYLLSKKVHIDKSYLWTAIEAGHTIIVKILLDRVSAEYSTCYAIENHQNHLISMLAEKDSEEGRNQALLLAVKFSIQEATTILNNGLI